VNGGVGVRPHVTRLVQDGPEEPTQWPPLGVARANLDLVAAGMNAVTMDPRGTAYKMRITDRGLEYGGKTGTSQVRRITMAERDRGVVKNEDKPWRERDHALFVGYAPIQAPRYVVSVIVEHGGGGSAVAAPKARDIINEAQRRNPARSPPAAPSAQAQPARTG